MTGMAAWQRVVHYLGEALMISGFGWAVYRMLVLHGCPTARFNDWSLIVLGLGIAIAPLHPFGVAPGYLTPHLLRNRGLAAALWAVSLAGAAFAVFALWQRWPSVYWVPVMLPAAWYMWFGIAPGKPAVGAAHGPPGLPEADVMPRPVGQASGLPLETSTGETPAPPKEKEECRLEASAPREEEPRDA